MIFAVLGCRDPVLREIDGVAVPASAEAPAPADPTSPRIGVADGAVWLDPTPWAPNLAPSRVLDLSDPQDHALALPALVAALEPVREAGPEDVPMVPEVRIDRDLPYRAAVRVLYSLGMAMSDGAWIAVQGGVLRFRAPNYCGEADGSGPRCVAVELVDEAAGLVVHTASLPADHDGCTVVLDWTGPAIPVGTDLVESSPSPSAPVLVAALDGTRSAGEPCGWSVVAPADGTPWGEVVRRWVAVRKLHPDAALATVPER